MPTSPMIKLTEFDIPEIKIRKEQSDSDHFQSTKRSIAIRGVQQAVMATKKIDGIAHPDKKLWLIDGLQRLEISKRLGLEAIPCDVQNNITQEELLLLQYTLNAHRIPQKPKERLEHFKRLMIMNPTWGIGELADRICEKIENLKRFLKLEKLTPEALELTDRGTIKLSAAAALASIPLDKQNEHLEEATVMPANEWVSRSKDLREAYRKARMSPSGGEVPTDIITPHPKSRNELIAMWQDAQAVFEEESTDYSRGRVQALAEVLQVDDATVSAKKRIKDQLKLERREKAAATKLVDAQNEIQQVLDRKKLQLDKV